MPKYQGSKLNWHQLEQIATGKFHSNIFPTGKEVNTSLTIKNIYEKPLQKQLLLTQHVILDAYAMKAQIRTFQCKNRQYYGDCIFFVLKDEDNDDSFHIMIDCGALSDEIKQFIIHNLGLRLDLIIATHLDGDHIDGITAILNDNDLKNLVVGKILYNCCFMPYDNTDNITFPRPIQYRINSLPSAYPDTARSKISASTSVSLANRILSDESMKSVWNHTPITNQTDPIPLGIKGKWGKLVFLSPTVQDLQNLDGLFKTKFAGFTGIKFPEHPFGNIQETYELLLKIEEKKKRIFKGKWIGAKQATISKEEFENAFNVIVNESSLSIPNQASMAFYWECNYRKVLFLGDSMAKTVKESLSRHFDGQIKFDAVKISHHGSKYNTTSELMTKIDAPVFYLTGGYSSEEDCPTMETIAKIAIRDTDEDSKRYIRYNYKNQTISRLISHANKRLRELYHFEMIDDNSELPYEFEY